MFRGWQLHADHRTLTELGSGSLNIDLLRQESHHNGHAVELSIARAIRNWWLEDMVQHNIDPSGVREARMEVQLTLVDQQGQRDTATVWANPAATFIR